MNARGGALLALIGVWVVCQVLGGSALQRLGILAAAVPPNAKPDATPKPTPPAQAAAAGAVAA